MEMASDFADLLDRPLTEHLDHFAFLMLLFILIFLGIREFRKQNIEEGIALIFLPFAYYFFAFFYFLNRSAEGRSDTFYDWRENWAFGLTQLFSSYNAPITMMVLMLNVLVFLFVKFILWCGQKAEEAGRSKVGFIVLAIIFPVIAWIVLLIIKPEIKKSN